MGRKSGAIQKLTSAQRQFVEDNINLAYFAANKYTKHFPFEYDDILSACYIGLVKAVQNFNPDMGFKFSTYAMQRIYFQIQKELIPRKPQVKTLYLEELLANKGDIGTLDWNDLFSDNRSTENEAIHNVLAEQYLKEINDNKKFSPRTKAIVNLHFNHLELTQAQIAKKVNCTQAQVNRVLKKISEQYRDKIIEQGKVNRS